jgi:hypothetical protein
MTDGKAHIWKVCEVSLDGNISIQVQEMKLNNLLVLCLDALLLMHPEFILRPSLMPSYDECFYDIDSVRHRAVICFF